MALVKDKRGKVPNYVIDGDPLRLRQQPTGLSVPLASKNHAHLRAAQTKLKATINAQ